MMARWEELPQKVLQLVARRLAVEDLLAFRVVCISWRSAAAKATNIAKSKAPWLMTYVCNHMAEFFRPSRGRTYHWSCQDLESRPCLQHDGFSCQSGAMITVWGYEYRVFNPLSRVSFELPALEKLHHESRLSVELDGLKRLWGRSPIIHRIALSSRPSSSRSYTIMVTICRDLRPLVYALHRSGEDAWTGVSPAAHLPLSHFLQLIHYNGRFVALDTHNRIMTLDERECRMRSWLVLGQNSEGCPYVVECSGSLLVAWKIWGKEDGTVKKIRVFEVDLEKGTKEGVKSLGNATLLLNGNSAISAEFNAQTCRPMIKSNRIYIT